jgi:hypothetical protein
VYPPPSENFSLCVQSADAEKTRVFMSAPKFLGGVSSVTEGLLLFRVVSDALIVRFLVGRRILRTRTFVKS